MVGGLGAMQCLLALPRTVFKSPALQSLSMTHHWPPFVHTRFPCGALSDLGADTLPALAQDEPEPDAARQRDADQFNWGVVDLRPTDDLRLVERAHQPWLRPVVVLGVRGAADGGAPVPEGGVEEVRFVHHSTTACPATLSGRRLAYPLLTGPPSG